MGTYQDQWDQLSDDSSPSDDWTNERTLRTQEHQSVHCPKWAHEKKTLKIKPFSQILNETKSSRIHRALHYNCWACLQCKVSRNITKQTQLRKRSHQSFIPRECRELPTLSKARTIETSSSIAWGLDTCVPKRVKLILGSNLQWDCRLLRQRHVANGKPAQRQFALCLSFVKSPKGLTFPRRYSLQSQSKIIVKKVRKVKTEKIGAKKAP